MKPSIRIWDPERDFEQLACWWRAAGETPPEADTVPRDGTFIAETIIPLVAVSYSPTDFKVGWVEFFIGNPKAPVAERMEGARVLLSFLDTLNHSHGMKRLFCMAPSEILQRYYRRLGFSPTASSIRTLTRETSLCHRL
jgi:hypothetical protein